MRRHATPWVFFSAMLAVGSLMARDVCGQGTSVQLPTYSSFSTNTTVDVPDGGSTFLGGISRSSEGRNEFGVPGLPFRPFKNAGIGQTTSASGMRVTATIHDFAAMDEAILNSAPTSVAAAGQTLQPRNPVNLAGSWAPRSIVPTQGPADAAPGPAATSLADLQARRAMQQQSRVAEAQSFFQRAQQAEADGKTGVARVYYQMVVRRANGDLKQQALAHLDAMGGSHAAAKVAQSQP